MAILACQHLEMQSLVEMLSVQDKRRHVYRCPSACRSWPLTTALLAIWGIEAGYALVRGHASWAWDDALSLELGLLGIWGDRNSLVGQYEGNSQAYGRVTYSF